MAKADAYGLQSSEGKGQPYLCSVGENTGADSVLQMPLDILISADPAPLCLTGQGPCPQLLHVKVMLLERDKKILEDTLFDHF